MFRNVCRYQVLFVYNEHDYDLVVPKGFCMTFFLLKSNDRLILEFSRYLIDICIFSVYTKSFHVMRLTSVFSKYQQKMNDFSIWKGTIEIGGVGKTWKIANENGRLNWFKKGHQYQLVIERHLNDENFSWYISYCK